MMNDECLFLIFVKIKFLLFLTELSLQFMKTETWILNGLDRTFSEKPFGNLNEEGIRRTRFTIVDHCVQCNYVAELYGVLRITS
ncbi:hypothetical protein C0J52_07893 [Blattella germanica]|nr:hypothetical protein C0J52_07893 [Blattella germanica]